MTTKDTFDREMKPLYAIRDNYEKIVLTLDKLTLGNYDGIRVIHVLDWLLNGRSIGKAQRIYCKSDTVKFLFSSCNPYENLLKYIR